MNLSPHKLAEIARVAGTIRETLGEDFDADTFRDTLDGETDVMDLIGALLTAEAEARAMEEANKAVADTYALRAKVMKERQGNIRGLLLRLVEAMGEKTVRHAFATLTVKAGKQEMIGTPDPETLPDHLVRIKREADKAAMRVWLEAGMEIPGVTLGNAAPSLTIRRA